MIANLKRIHFVAIAGSVMHQLALELKRHQCDVTGSDDEFFEPAKSELANQGLLPDNEGWFPEKITKDLDAVILGMHARRDNPELMKALDLNIPVYSFPEFIYLQSRDKQRFVISGSHGKTTITAMIIHVLKRLNKEFDYVIGAKVPGIDSCVKLSDAPVIIIEGDEYASSPIDTTPKFIRYMHHVGVINGISWDHMNVFPTEEDYLRAFEDFADNTPKAGSLIYNEEDSLASIIGVKQRADVNSIEYRSLPFEAQNGHLFIKGEDGLYPIKVFGKHNLQNMAAAMTVLKRMGISSAEFYEAIGSFEGAKNRLEILGSTPDRIIYKDYAHSPSKVSATLEAVKENHQDKKIIACYELHTFSSLNPNFLKNYKDTILNADQAIIFYLPETSHHKKLPVLNSDIIREAFNKDNLQVLTNANDLTSALESLDGSFILLLMSSGNFGGIDIAGIAKKLTTK